jgi:hypothetical protein
MRVTELAGRGIVVEMLLKALAGFCSRFSTCEDASIVMYLEVETFAQTLCCDC